MAGGTAIGEDTNGDLIETLPDGTQVFGIDVIDIAAENCEVTDPDNLSVTIDDQGVPGRFIDGENADITVDEDGVTINGGTGENGLLEPLLVDEDDAGEDPGINDTFTVVSTTGIGGEGCQPVETQDDDGDNNGEDMSGDDNDANGDDVIDDTIPDKDLPNTGGEVAAEAYEANAGVFAGAGALILLAALLVRIARFRRL